MAAGLPPLEPGDRYSVFRCLVPNGTEEPTRHPVVIHEDGTATCLGPIGPFPMSTSPPDALIRLGEGDRFGPMACLCDSDDAGLSIPGTQRGPFPMVLHPSGEVTIWDPSKGPRRLSSRPAIRL